MRIVKKMCSSKLIKYKHKINFILVIYNPHGTKKKKKPMFLATNLITIKIFLHEQPLKSKQA